MSKLTASEIVRVGDAVLMDEQGRAIGFDHGVVEAILAARLAAVEALADEYDRHENWRIWGVPQSIRAALTAAEPAPVSGAES